MKTRGTGAIDQDDTLLLQKTPYSPNSQNQSNRNSLDLLIRETNQRDSKEFKKAEKPQKNFIIHRKNHSKNNPQSELTTIEV